MIPTLSKLTTLFIEPIPIITCWKESVLDFQSWEYKGEFYRLELMIFICESLDSCICAILYVIDTFININIMII